MDIPRNQIHRFDPAREQDKTFDVGQPVGALALRADGGLIAAVRDGFSLFEPSTRSLTLVAAVEPENQRGRMNDGRCDDAGRFWAGSVAEDPLNPPGAGSLYTLGLDGRVTRALGGVSISNGMDWSPDGTLMYYIDTLKFTVDVFDFDVSAGIASNRRTLIRFPESRDPLIGPDGMCVDSLGFLWIAMWGGASVLRYSPEGSPTGKVHLPVTNVTSCTFGGNDLGDLYITTASLGLTPEELRTQPLAGALFSCRPGVTGREPNVFRGSIEGVRSHD